MCDILPQFWKSMTPTDRLNVVNKIGEFYHIERPAWSKANVIDLMESMLILVMPYEYECVPVIGWQSWTILLLFIELVCGEIQIQMNAAGIL